MYVQQCKLYIGSQKFFETSQKFFVKNILSTLFKIKYKFVFLSIKAGVKFVIKTMCVWTIILIFTCIQIHVTIMQSTL